MLNPIRINSKMAILLFVLTFAYIWVSKFLNNKVCNNNLPFFLFLNSGFIIKCCIFISLSKFFNANVTY